jgi:hypothetical protein
LQTKIKIFDAPAETGEESVAPVCCDEGFAIRIGPAPRVGVREDDGEAPELFQREQRLV